jgi:hypothetical protein
MFGEDKFHGRSPGARSDKGISQEIIRPASMINQAAGKVFGQNLRHARSTDRHFDDRQWVTAGI